MTENHIAVQILKGTYAACLAQRPSDGPSDSKHQRREAGKGRPGKNSGGLNGGERRRVLIFLRAATKARCFSRFINLGLSGVGFITIFPEAEKGW